jgi:antitoxin CcdA
MATRSRSGTAKQATNLSISGDLLRAAREAGVNLSAALEEALTERIAAAKREAWIRENAAAIAAYNNAVEQTGVFSDGARSF